jgi:protein gp37
MAETTNIAWADSTFNPWLGCQKVSPGCDHCYAEADFDIRRGIVKWGAKEPRKRTSHDSWRKPYRWNNRAENFKACGSCGWRGETDKNCCPHCLGNELHETRRRVFCGSLCDWLDNEVPIEWLLDLLDLIRTTPHLSWLLLTKRIGNWRGRISDAIHHIEALPDWPGDTGPRHPRESLRDWLANWEALGQAPHNVKIGATICNQDEADRDIPKLLTVPAAIRFLSIEPMLGAINLRHLNKDRENNEMDCLKPTTWEEEVNGGWRDTSDEWESEFLDWYGLSSMPDETAPMHSKIDWVICGGESGADARPMHPDWPRNLRDQCLAADVPFFFKQWGGCVPTEQFHDINEAYDNSTSGGWVSLDGEFMVGEGAMPLSQDAEHFVCLKVKAAVEPLLDGRIWNEVPA